MRLLTVLILFFCAVQITAQTSFQRNQSYEETAAEYKWVDEIFELMSEDERIGQLMMIRAHSDKGPKHVAKVESLVKDYNVGGLCFFQGTPEKQAELTNRFQSLAYRVPLLISMDAEWGLGMRLKKSTISFPRQLMLGAIQDNSLIYDFGAEVARHCTRLGVHLNFAPVADVNNNPLNPVINYRSFGEDIYNVAVKSYKYMQGMQDHDVLACAKHFPGHGDTDVDSHKDLPVIPHDRNRLDSLEIMPFRVLIDKGVASVMVAHMSVPAIDATENRPTTLSPAAINDLLKDELHFEGLVITDGLGMKGVTKYYGPGETEAEALIAGNDILLLPQDIPAAFAAIKKYIAEGKLNRSDVYESVKKILHFKYRQNLRSRAPHVSLSNIRADLNRPESIVLKKKLIQNALTLVRNDDNIVPFRQIHGVNYGSVSLGAKVKTKFQSILDKYAPFAHFQAPINLPTDRKNSLLNSLKNKDVVIVSIHDMSSYARKDFGISASQRQFIEELRKETTVVLTIFGSPYSLKYFDAVENVLVAYDEDEMTQEITAQGLFGAFGFKGRLPVSATPRSLYNMGIQTNSLFRLGYGIPEESGLDADSLNINIGKLMDAAIAERATPGGVVLVAKNGKIVFEKAYGYHTYDKRRPVSTSDIYDLASVTKVAATTLSAMKLQDSGVIDISNNMSKYIINLDTTNKASMTVTDMMTHRSGLKPWIPFYSATMTESRRNPQPKPEWYSRFRKELFSVEVTDKLYMKYEYQDSIWNKIYSSDLRDKRNYKYSDLGFYLLAKMVKEQTGQEINDYARNTFYRPMGLRTLGYNPTNRFPKDVIPPTEKDNYFRKQTVSGYVHDMGAAMLGGVAGHAGLFGKAEDLAIVFQMLLNKGYYGGVRYFEQGTVDLFTNRCNGCTRRGIGFDMKQLDSRSSANMGDLASDSTFGHLGFTGIAVWADPEHNLVFVFLSNRTYPSMKNYRLNKKNYRPRIQDAVYRAIKPIYSQS
ncbi:MAG: beta-N-acetylhexosaminidase [Saprospiraceae bacterium]|jgi:beta-N-acetylhexosaminidase